MHSTIKLCVESYACLLFLFDFIKLLEAHFSVYCLMETNDLI